MMRIDLGIFGFMVMGSLGGAIQHLFFFDSMVASDLTPTAIGSNNVVNPAASFWGGEFAGACSLATALMALIYYKHSIVREAYLTWLTIFFSILAIAWFRKGESVGNKKWVVVVAFDTVLALVALIGACLTAFERSTLKRVKKE